MKNTGKTFKGVPVYTDPEIQKNKVYLLSGRFVESNPRRKGVIVSVLDETLKDTLHNYNHGIAPDIGPEDSNDNEAIGQIKQAFKDAGYSKSPLANIKLQMEISGMLTGQGWYDKFFNEFNGLDRGFHGGFVEIDKVYEAARKAAGLSDENT